MKTLHIFLLFIIVAIAQLFIPAKMILNHENILNTGTEYKFNTRPVDPADPFRGKYITLFYDINSSLTEDTTWKRKEKAYVYIKKDSLGFAQLINISKKQLNIENEFVITEVSWYDPSTKKVHFNFPFNRYYMKENKAKLAENVYLKAQQDSLPNNIYGLVYVKNGEAVLKDVVINNTSMAQYVE